MSPQDPNHTPAPPRPMSGKRLKQFQMSKGYTLNDMIWMLGANSNHAQRTFKSEGNLAPRTALFTRLLIEQNLSILPERPTFKEVFSSINAMLPDFQVEDLAIFVGLRKQDGMRLMVRPEATSTVSWNLYLMHKAISEQHGVAAKKSALVTFVQSAYNEARARTESTANSKSTDWDRSFYKLLARHGELAAMVSEEVEVVQRQMTGQRLKHFQLIKGHTLNDMVWMLGADSKQAQRIFKSEGNLAPRIALFARLLIEQNLNPLPEMVTFKDVYISIKKLIPDFEVIDLSLLVGLRKSDGERLMIRPEASNTVRWNLYLMNTSINEQRGTAAKKAALATFVQNAYNEARARTASAEKGKSIDWDRNFYKLLERRGELLAMIGERVDLQSLLRRQG